MFKKIGKVVLLSMLTVGSLSAELMTIKANAGVYCKTESLIRSQADDLISSNWNGKFKDGCWKYNKDITLDVADIYEYRAIIYIMHLKGNNGMQLWYLETKR